MSTVICHFSFVINRFVWVPETFKLCKTHFNTLYFTLYSLLFRHQYLRKGQKQNVQTRKKQMIPCKRLPGMLTQMLLFPTIPFPITHFLYRNINTFSQKRTSVKYFFFHTIHFLYRNSNMSLKIDHL